MRDDIPVVSVKDLAAPEALAELDRACTEWGFFQIVDHGVDAALMDEMLVQMARFFRLPDEAKRAIERTAANPWGFFDRELTKNVRDWKQIFDFGPADDDQQPQWPAGLPGFRDVILRFYAACETISLRLVGAIAANLGVEAHTLTRCFENHTSYLRLNYYPRCPDPSRHLGVSRHSDAGAVTVLLQDDHAALQVERDGDWHVVPPRDGALVVNVGDVVQVWSNDRYRAPLHRVLAQPDHERYSAPFFLNPSYETSYAPLGPGPSRYRPINWREFRAGRSAGDYADDGEEIQISDFRV